MWPVPKNDHFFSGNFVRTKIAEPVSSTVIAMPSPNFCAPAASEEETVIFARTRTSGKACVPIRMAPWLCSMSSRWPALTGIVREKSRS